MFKVTANVFGAYTFGKLEGQTNPKQVIGLTMYGDSAKAAMGKINKAANGAFFTVEKVEDLRPPHIIALERLLKSAPHLQQIAA